jgi:hypothetical protein
MLRLDKRISKNRLTCLHCRDPEHWGTGMALKKPSKFKVSLKK